MKTSFTLQNAFAIFNLCLLRIMLIYSSNVQFSFIFLEQKKSSHIPPMTALQATPLKETGTLRALRYRLIESN